MVSLGNGESPALLLAYETIIVEVVHWWPECPLWYPADEMQPGKSQATSKEQVE